MADEQTPESTSPAPQDAAPSTDPGSIEDASEIAGRATAGAAEEVGEVVSDPSQSAPDDADDLRGFHFRRLIRKQLTLILTGILAVAAAIGLAIAAGPVFAPVGAVVAALLVVIVVFFIADSAAEEAFFTSYAQARGMSRSGKGPLPAATELLRNGDERYGEQILRGPLAEGVDGTLALYTYEEEYRDSKGNKQTNYYHYTIGIAEIPECAKFLPSLVCQRKFGLRGLEKVEDAFRKKERVKFESVELDENYEIFVNDDQDQNWLRQLFSPSFIVWLNDSAPEKFAFEVEDGVLCCNIKGHKKSAAELDVMRDATAGAARRLREEAAE